MRKGQDPALLQRLAADARIGIDSQRLHYQELTIKSTFHHTPESVRKAFRLIADGHVDPKAFISGEAPLDRLPEVLRRMAHGGAGLAGLGLYAVWRMVWAAPWRERLLS